MIHKLKAYNFTKSDTPPWVFFTFFKLYRYIQSVCMWNYFGAGFNETHALFGKLPLTNVTIQHSLPYPGISFHYVKSVQIRRFFWSVFSCIWTEFGDLRSNVFLFVMFKWNVYVISLYRFSFDCVLSVWAPKPVCGHLIVEILNNVNCELWTDTFVPANSLY